MLRGKTALANRPALTGAESIRHSHRTNADALVRFDPIFRSVFVSFCPYGQGNKLFLEQAEYVTRKWEFEYRHGKASHNEGKKSGALSSHNF